MRKLLRAIIPIKLSMFFVFLVMLSKCVCVSIAFAKSEYVKIEEGNISVDAKEAYLREIAKAIENRTGTVFKLMGEIKEKIVSAKFIGLPLLQGIKKLVYPYNYVIIHNRDKAISKVIVLDINSGSQSEAYNNNINDVVSSYPDGSGYTSARMVNSGEQTSSRGWYDRTSSSSNQTGQGTKKSSSPKSHEQKENKTDGSGTGVPNSSNTSSSRRKAKDRSNNNNVSTQSGSRVVLVQSEKGCGTGFYFNDGNNEEWRLLGMYDGEKFESIPEFDNTAPFDSTQNAPTDTPYHNSLGYNQGSIFLRMDENVPLESPTDSDFVHWELSSPDLSGDGRWQEITSFSYDIKNEIVSEEGSIHVQAVLVVKQPDLTEKRYIDKNFLEILTDKRWRTYKVDVKALEIPKDATIISLELRIFFGTKKSYKGVILVDNVIPLGSNGCSEEISTLIKLGENWKYFKGSASPRVRWNDEPFDDSDWLEGPTGIGYRADVKAESETKEYKTVLSDMKDNYRTLYARKAFNIEDETSVTDMILRIDYDDGFVAYINGQEVARAHMPEGKLDHETEALEHESGLVEVFDLSEHKSGLVQGANVLAIEMHNESIESTDLALFPELEIKVQPE